MQSNNPRIAMASRGYRACAVMGFFSIVARAGLVEGLVWSSSGGFPRAMLPLGGNSIAEYLQPLASLPSCMRVEGFNDRQWALLRRGWGHKGLISGSRRDNGGPLGLAVEPTPPLTMAGNSTLSVEGVPAESVTVVEVGVVPSGGALRQSLLKTLWEFSRPHTMIGTAIAIPAMGVFAAPPGVLPGRQFFLAMIWAMVPSLLINVYVTGLNQITDVEIDQVNKPNLPIPAGHLSPKAAKGTVALCLVAGMVLGLMPSSLGSPGLALTVLLSVLIGSAYSLPPLRLKRFPQLAALCVLIVRGSIINGGFYAHAQAAAYGLATKRTAWEALSFPLRDAKCALALAYFTVFAVVIALMKDVPDVAGDRKFNIPSFSVVLGEERLFAFARRLLTTLLWGTSASLGFGARKALESGLRGIAACRGFVALAALACGQKVRMRARQVNPKRPDHVTKFYMFLWKIFYVSYVFLPLAR